MIGPGLERGWPAYQTLPLSHGGKGISFAAPLRLHLCLHRLHTHCFYSLFQTTSNQTTWLLLCQSLQCKIKTFSAMFAQSNTAHLSLAFAFIICFKIINEVLPRDNSANTFISLRFSKDIKWNPLCPEGLSLWSGADPMRSWAITIPTQGPASALFRMLHTNALFSPKRMLQEREPGYLGSVFLNGQNTGLPIYQLFHWGAERTNR